MSGFMLEWQIQSSDVGKWVKQFLKEQHISKSALTDIKFHGGRITVNDHDVNVRYLLKENDVLKVEFPTEKPSISLIGEDIPLDIVYEDEFVLVINKPMGMNTIPSREHPTGSLANGLIGHFQRTGLQATTHIVTRLDRHTSGLVLVAKQRHIRYLLSEQQKKGMIDRTYEAIVEGILLPEKGTIEEPIGRKSDSIIEREVRSDGQYALTHYRVLQRYPQYTWIELHLETGRTHQIRVHLAYMGHPLLGDELYGGQKEYIHRQALLCKQISFEHPYYHKRYQFSTDLPDDMRELL